MRLFHAFPAVLTGAGLILAAVPGHVRAQSSGSGAAKDPAAIFGSRNSVEDVALSPDGRRLAYVTPMAGQASALLVVDLDKPGAKATPVLTANGSPERMGSCNWVGTNRLMCNAYAAVEVEGKATYINRLVAVDANGGDMKVLGIRSGSGVRLGYALYGGSVIDWNPSEDGHILMMRDYVPESQTGTRLAQTRDGIGVDLVNTRTLAARTVERPQADADEFISDGYGRVRIKGRSLRDPASGYATGEALYLYRKPDSDNWEELSRVREDALGFNPYAVDRSLNVAYGVKRLDGRLAAYRVALDGSRKEELVFAHPQVDVAGFVRIGRRNRVIGVRYVTDKPQVHYLDAEIARMAGALSRAIPNLPLIRVVDSSEDEQKMVVWAGSDVDPGRYFLFDRQAKSLSELMLSRPDLEHQPLGTMRPVNYPSRDGASIPAYLTLPPGKTDATGLPALVMPHGGPGSRDEWGFDWMVQYFATQGYAVLQPNFRGSTGYGDAWFQKNGFQSWKVAVGDVNDAGRWLVAQGADARRLGVFGWSYGGYAALQSAVLDPDLFKAVVAVAPVTDLERLKEDRRNWSDYRLVTQFVGSGPHIAEGSPARHAAAFRAPVLMFHGDMDRNVNVGHARLMDARLKAAGKSSELHIYKDRDHYLEDSAIRTEMLSASKAFYEKAFAAK